jgi:hypothetical protein
MTFAAMADGGWPQVGAVTLLFVSGANTMGGSGLSPSELSLAVRACAYLHLPRQRGEYFREFLARCLEQHHPELAQTIRELVEAELDALHEYIRDCQALGD